MLLNWNTLKRNKPLLFQTLYLIKLDWSSGELIHFCLCRQTHTAHLENEITMIKNIKQQKKTKLFFL
jgi:hypothetical protein